MRTLQLLLFLLCFIWTNANALESFTVCIRFKITHFSYNFIILESRDRILVDISLANPSNAGYGWPLVKLFTFQSPDTVFLYMLRRSDDKIRDPMDAIVMPKKWHHWCVAIDGASNTVQGVSDGDILESEKIGEQTKVSVKRETLQDLKANNCSYQSDVLCINNKGTTVADLGIWGKALSHDEMVAWSSCRKYITANVMSWYKTQSVWENKIKSTEICTGSDPVDVLFPWFLTMAEAKRLCEKYKGKASIITSAEMRETLFLQMDTVPELAGCAWPKCVAWTGFSDENEEGNYVDVNEEKALNFDPWAPGEPNGKRNENCGISYKLRSGWYDAPCDSSLSSFCRIEETSRLHLRGMGKNMPFDTGYTLGPSQMLSNDFTLSGYLNTNIAFDNITKSWTIQMPFNSEQQATTNGTMPPFGTQKYILSKTLGGGHIYLNINACDESKEYNCKDGSCIQSEKRCDSKIDCFDASDESDCDKISIPESYLKHVPAQSRNQGKTVITLDLEIWAVQSISEVAELFSVKFKLTMSWIDPRLTFLNIKEDTSMNIVGPTQAAKIWYPIVVFINTRKMDLSKHDLRSTMTIIRNGRFRISPNNELHNNRLYKGKDNKISITRVYSADFECKFAMHFYPFDIQQCNMNFVLEGTSGQDAELVKGIVDYFGAVDLLQYYIVSYEIIDNNLADTHASQIWAVQVRVKLGRRIMNQAISQFLPAIIINVICYLTNYFKPKYFEGSIGVNAVSLVTLTTLFTSVVDSLPRTAYLKLIDFWFVMSLCIPAIEMLLHAIIAGLVRHDDKVFTVSKRVPKRRPWMTTSFWVKISRVGLPIAYVVVALAIVLPGVVNVAMLE